MTSGDAGNAATESHDVIDEMAAACFLWSSFRCLRWKDDDDPADVALYHQTMAKARKEWPWLDKAADAFEAHIIGQTIAEANPR